MKKTVTSTVIATAIAAAAMTSCQKENVSAPVSSGELCTIHIAENATRSAYDPATNKITLDHQELMGLFYLNASIDNAEYQYAGQPDTNSQNKTNYLSAVKANPAAPYNGSYIFTKPDKATNNWVGIIPYSKGLVQANSSYTSIYCRLAPNQFPDGNSFDPHCDYLVSKPFAVEDGKGTITEFKRLFTPFRLNITGLNADDKISAVTFKINTTPAQAHRATLTGTFYVKAYAESYSGQIINSVEKSSMSNGVSAIYDTPLSKDADGKWPVWFIVNPTTIPAGTGITVTVTTADKTYTRTVTTTSENIITADKMNIMDFSMAEGKRDATYTETIMQSFLDQNLKNNKTITLASNNGGTLEWTFTGKNILYNSEKSDNESGLHNALRLTNASVTIPDIKGKNITKLRVYSHPILNNKPATGKLILCKDESELASIPFSIYASAVDAEGELTTNGGYVDFTLPTKEPTLSGMTLKGSSDMNVISAIVMTVEDKVESAE